MQKHYNLSFKPGTVTEINGTKADLICEMQNIIEELSCLKEDDYGIDRTILVYDTNGKDYIEARITD